MQITRKHFALLIGTLFAISLLADPVIHSLEDEDHHHEIIECQACESESSEAHDHYFLESYVQVSVNFYGPKENYKGSSRAIYSARAPPKT